MAPRLYPYFAQPALYIDLVVKCSRVHYPLMFAVTGSVMRATHFALNEDERVKRIALTSIRNDAYRG